MTLSLDQEVTEEPRHIRGRLDQQPPAVAGQDHQPVVEVLQPNPFPLGSGVATRL